MAEFVCSSGVLRLSCSSLEAVGTPLSKQDVILTSVRWRSRRYVISSVYGRSSNGAILGCQWCRGKNDDHYMGYQWSTSNWMGRDRRGVGSRVNVKSQSYESSRGRRSDGEVSDWSDDDEDALIGRMMYSKGSERSWRDTEEKYKGGSRYKFRDQEKRNSVRWDWEDDERGADFAQYMWLNPWIREAVGGLKSGLPFLIVAMPFLLMTNPIFLAIAPVVVAIFPLLQRFFQAPLQNLWRLFLSIANHGIWDEERSRKRRSHKYRGRQRERTYARPQRTYASGVDDVSNQERDKYGGW